MDSGAPSADDDGGGSSSGGLSLPSFSAYPQAWATAAGEALLALPAALESALEAQRGDESAASASSSAQQQQQQQAVDDGSAWLDEVTADAASAALAQVVTAEVSRPVNRARSLAIVSAGYGIGAGLNALVHSMLRGEASFRFLFLTCAVPLVAVLAVARWVPEPVIGLEEAGMVRPRFGRVAPGEGGRLLKVMGLIVATSLTSSAASSFVFVYGENIVRLSKGIESGMIIAAASTGLVGLLLGRRVADGWGRRPAIALGITGIALSAMVLYSGSKEAVVVGYLLIVLSTGFIAPAGTAYPNELFGTQVRATVAGWGIVAGVIGAAVGLVSFGLVADRWGAFEVAALVVSLPILAGLWLLTTLPETRGIELAGTLGATEG